jgi:hypothetical protein
MLVHLFMRIFRRWPSLMALGLALLVSACATHSGFETNADGSLEPYGFFSGIWHGIIFPFVFLLAIVANIGFNVLLVVLWLVEVIFNSNKEFHRALSLHFLDFDFVGQPNTGLFYYIGYLIGLGESLGGSTAVNQRRQ